MARKRPTPRAIVPQRRHDDCAIAAVANATGWTYERSAETLGFPCDPTTGLPGIPLTTGFSLFEMVPPLLSGGISGAYLIAREHPNAPQIAHRHTTQLYPSDRLKSLMQGRRALVAGSWTDLEDDRRGHVLAWDGTRLIGQDAPADLSEATIWEAVILSPAGKAEMAPAPTPAGGDDLAALFDRHERVFLAFSGGKESVALAHMCEPWREKVTLVWVRVQFHAPHMAAFIRGYADRGWRLEEVAAPDLMAHWRAGGTPTEIVPVANAAGFKEPRLQPWLACCYAVRQVPLNAFLHAQNETCALIQGQRKDDKASTVGGLSGQLPPHVEVVQPLRDWSEQDVLAYIAENDLTLPEQYAEGFRDSVECLVCPATLTPQRMAYLDRRYPVPASIARKTALASTRVALQAITDLHPILAPILPVAPNPPLLGEPR